MVKPAPGQLDAIALAFPDLELRRQLLEVDYSTFPVDEARMVESVRGAIAQFIRCRILEIDSPEDFIALRELGEYTKVQLNWARKNILTVDERAALYAVVLGEETQEVLSNIKQQDSNVISIETKKRKYGSKKRIKVSSAG